MFEPFTCLTVQARRASMCRHADATDHGLLAANAPVVGPALSFTPHTTKMMLCSKLCGDTLVGHRHDIPNTPILPLAFLRCRYEATDYIAYYLVLVRIAV